MIHCHECQHNPLYHYEEAQRISALFDTGELDAYADDGVVKVVLRQRIQQEMLAHQFVVCAI